MFTCYTLRAYRLQQQQALLLESPAHTEGGGGMSHFEGFVFMISLHLLEYSIPGLLILILFYHLVYRCAEAA